MYASWDYWQLYQKVTFDGINKLITVNDGVINLDIRRDVYSAWVRWIELGTNTSFLPAIRYAGLDPIPGGFTGDTYFLINGWKLIIDLTTVSVTGVLFSDDYNTAYYSASLKPQYPAVVASLVSTVTNTVYQNIVTGTVPTPAEISTAVWDSPATNVPGSFGELISKKMLTIAKFLGLK
jgi:hypothetical protein